MPTSTLKQLSPIPFTHVRFTDSFWASRMEINRTVSIPLMYEQLDKTGRLGAFDLNFTRPLPARITQIFGDSDVAKWMEAAACALTTHPDPTIAALLDQTVNRVIQAQQPDGYLNTHFSHADPAMRWKNLRDWHELYCAGHLIEAAIAHHQATGNPKLLNALRRYADYIDETFGPEPGQKRGYCGHPEIELALIRLYHATNEPRYLKLAQYFVDERGQQPNYYDLEARERGEDPRAFWAKSYDYMQAHIPVREQTQVVGHAVRAMYLYSAIADLAHETSDESLLHVCEQLWDNLCNRRLYLTGGLGPSSKNEGFTTDYDLPDETAYAETCASIALIFWNHRLLQFAGEGRYADLIEQTLYNGFISGVSLDGEKYSYENPLASSGQPHRSYWFECPCCPPNLNRLLATLGNYVYSTSANAIWVHLYAQSEATIQVKGQNVLMRQVTQYPWEGAIKLGLELESPQQFELHLRLPGWCERWQLRVNGEDVANLQPIDGYINIEREWANGDEVRLNLEMPVQTVWAHPAVRQMQGRLALQRGPIVYCLEGIDHPDVDLDRVLLNPASISSFKSEYQADLLGGVTVLRGQAEVMDEAEWGNRLYRQSQPPATKPVEIMAVPYCLWDNRAPGQMRVWFPRLAN